MSETLASTARASLEAERDALRHQLTELGAGGEGLSFDEGFADSSQVAAEQGEVGALVASLEGSLAEVEKALGKLDDDTYGTCEVCGEAIAEPRLEALPATPYCVQHA